MGLEKGAMPEWVELTEKKRKALHMTLCVFTPQGEKVHEDTFSLLEHAAFCSSDMLK